MVAIDKPTALLVHRTRQSRDHVYAVQLLRDQLNQFVYPVHRLDRPTSGVLLFALDTEMASLLMKLFEERRVSKTYYALVRGQLGDSGSVTHPLKDAERNPDEAVEAVTHYRCLATTRVSDDLSSLNEKKYSFVEAKPETGRMHQLRKHFAHVSHPIIGDTRYGKGDHNRLFKDVFQSHRLLLHAGALSFVAPETDERVTLSAELPEDFAMLKKRLFSNGQDVES